MKLARKHTSELAYHRNACKLQRILRGSFKKYRFLQFRKAIISLQCVLRVKHARKHMKELRTAAKDLGRLQQSNEELKKEIALLRAKAVEDARVHQLEKKSRKHEENTIQLQLEVDRLKRELVQSKAMVEMERKFRAEAESKVTSLMEQLQAAQSYIKQADEMSSPTRQSSWGLPSTLSLPDMIQAQLASGFQWPVQSSSGQVMSPSQSVSPAHSLPVMPTQAPTTRKHKKVNALSHSRSLPPTPRRDVSIPPRKDIISVQPQPSKGGESDDGEFNGSGSMSEDGGDVIGTVVHRSTMSPLSPSSNNVIKMTEDDERCLRQATEANLIADRSVGPIAARPASIPVRRRSKHSSPVPPPQPEEDEPPSDNPLLAGLRSPSSSVIGAFERNMNMYRVKIKQGVQIFVWEGARVVKLEAQLRLEGEMSSAVLIFQLPVRRFSLFVPRVEVQSLRMSDVLEILPGIGAASSLANNLREYQVDDSGFITILSAPLPGPRGGGSRAQRVIAMLFETREERNDILQGLRSVAQEVRMAAIDPCGTSTSIMPVATSSSFSSQAITTTITPISVPTRHPSRSRSQSNSTAPRPSISAASPPSISSGYSQVGQGSDEIENGEVLLARQSSGSSSSRPSSVARSRSRAMTVDGVKKAEAVTSIERKSTSVEDKLNTEKLMNILHSERARYERLMLQMLELTNDLNDREDYIIVLKKRESLLLAEMESKEKAYEADCGVRVQLTKRLNQVLMDKEDVKEQLEIMQEQMEKLMYMKTEGYQTLRN